MLTLFTKLQMKELVTDSEVDQIVTKSPNKIFSMTFLVQLYEMSKLNCQIIKLRKYNLFITWYLSTARNLAMTK